MIAANRAGVPDIICCISGQFIAFEVKRPGNKLSALQERDFNNIWESGGQAFVVTSVSTVENILINTNLIH